MPLTPSLLHLCGHTPIMRLSKLAPHRNVYLKLENHNPGKSVKDRPVLEMLTHAESTGSLRPGMTIVESTSGNTGIALALYGRLKGYHVLCIVDENIPSEKLHMLHAYGAQTEIILSTDGTKNADLTELRIQRIQHLLAENDHYFNLNQYQNPANPLAHERHTATEILRQAPPDLKTVVLSAGTGGRHDRRLAGIKKERPDLLIYGVEPEGSLLFGGTKGPYLQQGPGNYFIPAIMDYSCIDRHMKVDDRAAFYTARALANQGLLLGGSSGAVASALQIANELGTEGSVLAAAPDAGEKYLDSVYSDEWLDSHGLSITS